MRVPFNIPVYTRLFEAYMGGPAVTNQHNQPPRTEHMMSLLLGSHSLYSSNVYNW